MTTEWYYAVDGVQYGPVSSQELKRLADYKRILPEHLVWRSGLKNWIKAANVKGLFTICIDASPPLPQIPPLREKVIQIKLEPDGKDNKGLSPSLPEQPKEQPKKHPLENSSDPNNESIFQKNTQHKPAATALSAETPGVKAAGQPIKREKNSFQKDPTKLTVYLKIMLWVWLLLNIISIYMDFGQLDYLRSTNITREGLANINSKQAFIGLSYFLAYIVTGITFLMWIYRANLNARGFGAKDLKFTPGWSIGWYFIPFMSLFKPYQAMSEIWKASKNHANWKNESGSALLRGWWSLWLISSFLSQISFKASMRADSLITHLNATYSSIFSEIVEIPLTLVAIALISEIYTMQKRVVGLEIRVDSNQHENSTFTVRERTRNGFGSSSLL